MTGFDVLIVGAGPGGSNAAAVALDAGLSVAQIDAARFPRVKPCAGGITLKGARSLRLDLGPSLCASFDSIEFNVWGRRTNRFVHAGPVLHLVCRPEFDNRLVEQNLEKRSFTFIDGCRVTDVSYDGRFKVQTDTGSLTSAQLIGADGAHSIVNRRFRISSPRRVATAVEVNVESSARGDAAEVPSLDYGAIERGYGWVFPKGDHWSVGLYTVAPSVRDIRSRLHAYMQSKGLRPSGNPMAGLQAARLPIGGFRLRIPACPVYVVGDAGGFADALTGEGIYAALESGRIAGEVAVDVAYGRTSHRAFYRRLWRSVLCDTALTFLFAREFYRHIDRSVGVLQHPLVWRPLIQGSASGATFSECLLKSGLYLPRSLIGGDRAQRTGWPSARAAAAV